MIDGIFEAIKIAVKSIFLAVPLVLISLILSLGSGTLDYQELKTSAIEVYETADSVLSVLSKDNLNKITSFATSLIDNPGTDTENDGWLSIFFKSGVQWVVDAFKGIFDSWITIEPTG